MPDVTVIAVDGPAAAGKGTLARRLAAHFGLRYHDSGRLYRAVAAQLLRAGDAPDDAKKAVAAAQSLTEDDLDAHCRSSDLSNFRRPRRYVFVREIPKSPVGKLLRRLLVAGEYEVEPAETTTA